MVDSTQPPFSKQAGTALGLGLLGGTIPVVGLPLSLAAVVLGHVAIEQMRHTRTKIRGKWAAVIGLVAGYLAIAMLPVVAIGAYFLAPVVQQKLAGQQQAKIDVMMERGRALWQASESYAAEHGDRYPANWTQLEGRYLSHPELRNLLEGRATEKDGATRFRVVRHERPILPALKGTVMVIEENAPESVAEVVVIFDDGTVDIRRNPATYE